MLLSLVAIAAAMEKPSKALKKSHRNDDDLDRLQRLRHMIPHCTQSALSAILSFSKSDLPDGKISRQDIMRSRDAEVQVATPYGKIHQTIANVMMIDKKPPLTLEIQHPCVRHVLVLVQI